MATPNEMLAASLSVLEDIQSDGRRVFGAKELGRVHRERLLKNGFSQEVMSGWQISSGPGVSEGDSTPRRLRALRPLLRRTLQERVASLA